MLLADSISRFQTYFLRHGASATLSRACLFVRRLIFANRMVVFYFDLTNPDSPPATTILPPQLIVERKEHKEQIDAPDWQKMVSYWNQKLSSRKFAERLRQGASLWLIRAEGKVAGYGWTMTGHTIESHYCPLGRNDVHFFDFLVFPEFRGRQINPRLVNYMLEQLAAERRVRAYIEVAEWNQPQLNSLRKTPFRLLGVARKASFFGRTFVEWTECSSKPGASAVAAPIPGSRVA